MCAPRPAQHATGAGRDGRRPAPLTRPDGIRGHEHAVQPVALHEAADPPHGAMQAGHVLPVAPDEVLPSEVDAEVRAPQRGAQPDLAEEGRDAVRRTYELGQRPDAGPRGRRAGARATLSILLRASP